MLTVEVDVPTSVHTAKQWFTGGKGTVPVNKKQIGALHEALDLFAESQGGSLSSKTCCFCAPGHDLLGPDTVFVGVGDDGNRFTTHSPSLKMERRFFDFSSKDRAVKFVRMVATLKHICRIAVPGARPGVIRVFQGQCKSTTKCK